VSAILRIALGIIAAIGGFVDIGDLVFNAQAGSAYGYTLLWAVPVGVLGIMVYAEMCGRVAAVTGRPVIDCVRERLGFGPALMTVIAGQVINLLTVAAELGGVAIILQLLTDAAFTLWLVVGAAAIVAVVSLLSFEGIERVFGYGGLLLLVFVVAALHESPDWGAVGHGFVPDLPADNLYWYFVVGLISAALMPYEVYFYSSGGVEERWGPKDLRVNRLNAIIGYGLGGILSLGIMILTAQVFHPVGVSPDSLGTVGLSVQQSFGQTGLLLALLGMLMAVSGATIDSSFAAAYTTAQFCGWEWGRYQGPRKAPRFTLTWLAVLAAGVTIVLSGIDPVDLTEFSVVFSVVCLPLTYLPVLLVAGDRRFMHEHANGPLARTLGWLYFGVIGVLAVAAVPLLLTTNGGAG
jgi:Mn2+/Fe2+ NRAMP family transporter